MALPLIIIILGLAIGSFLTVCIYRIPYGRSEYLDELGEQPPEYAQTDKKSEDGDNTLSLTNPPRSFCPRCKAPIFWYHNIPVVSWIMLGGKCRQCAGRISARYPAVELLTAVSALLSYQHFGISPTALMVFIFCAALITISFIDYDYYIIPDVISKPGILLGLVLAGLNSWQHIFTPPMAAGIVAAVWGILAGAGFLFLVSVGFKWLRNKDGLGFGDVKLLAMTGAFFGPEASLYTIFVGSLLGSVGGALLILFHGRKMGKPIPFGPYLALGTFAYIFWGMEPIVWLADFIHGQPYSAIK